jgi:CRP/FNR family transcriptional regulator
MKIELSPFNEAADTRTGGPPTLRKLRGEALAYYLRRAEVFADLPPRELQELSQTAVLRHLEKGGYLFHKDEAAPGLYLVRQGIINLHRVAADGREIVIHFYREGELIPEIAGCAADARAVVPSEVIVVPRRSLLEVLRRCPELALRLLGAFDQQVRQLADLLEGISSRNAAGRFVHWLLSQCAEASATESVVIQLGTTKRALAGELGVRQETLSRMLRRLSDSGHLRVNGRRITVRNVEALRTGWTEDSSQLVAA